MTNKNRGFSRRQILSKAALPVAALLVSALIGEFALRMLGYHGAPQSFITNMAPVDDPVLDWRYIPNSETVMGRVVHRYNKAGFRDLDHAVENPLSRPRILVLGDSVTEGYGVRFESIFSTVLQQRLREEFEVITLGMAGLNTPQEVHLLETDGLAYQPDFVVLNFVLNDCDFHTRYRPAKAATERADSTIGILGIPVDRRVKRALKSSALIYFITQNVEHIAGLYAENRVDNYYLDIWSHSENRDKIVDSFAQLAKLKKEHGFELVVLLWPIISDYETYPYGEIHEFIVREARSNGFAEIDLLEAFASHSFRELQITSEDNVHPNEKGHQLGVDALTAWLATRENSLPTRDSPRTNPPH